MEHLESIREKLREGQKMVSAARANLKALGREEALDHMAAAQAHIDQAGKALSEEKNLRQASFHIGQVSEELETALAKLRG